MIRHELCRHETQSKSFSSAYSTDMKEEHYFMQGELSVRDRLQVIYWSVCVGNNIYCLFSVLNKGL